jgi:hypothetical protein
MQMAFWIPTALQDREHTVLTHSWKGVHDCGGSCRHGRQGVSSCQEGKECGEQQCISPSMRLTVCVYLII